MNNYCEVSPYLNPERRLGALLNFPIPSAYSSADGTERTIVLARNDGAAIIYDGPMESTASWRSWVRLERYAAIEVNGVPSSVPNAEMVRLFEKCIFRLPFSVGRRFFTFHEFLASEDCLAG